MNQEIVRDLKQSKTPDLPNHPIGPGAYLRKGRERRHQSQLDIAKQLQLNPAVIDALENDRYDKLPGAIFVRGYLRGYARIVDLVEDEIVQIYNNLDVAKESALPQTLTQAYPAAERIARPHPLLRYVPYILLLTLAGLLLVKYVELPADLSTLFSSSEPPAQTVEPQAFAAAEEPMAMGQQSQPPIEIEGSAPLVRPVPAENVVPIVSQPIEMQPVQTGE